MGTSLFRARSATFPFCAAWGGGSTLPGGGLSKIQVWGAQKDSNPHISVSARPKTQMRIGEFHPHLLALTREADKTLGGGIDRLR